MRACARLLPVLLALSVLPVVLPAQSPDRLCDASFEDCRAPLLDLIRNEQVGIDVAFRLMTDVRYAQEIIRRWQAGVPVRVLVDPRAVPAVPAHTAIIDLLRAAGIPVHLRLSGDVLHWRMMLFAGQRVVQFSGADYTPRAFAPIEPIVDAVDEAIYFTGDPVVVNSFMTRYDDLWVTIGGGTTEAFAAPRVRLYPQFDIDPDLQLPSAAGLDFGERSALQYRMETTGIDAIVPVITDRRHTDALIDARSRGVRIRIITDAAAYRDPARPFHAWNVDRLHAAGVALRLHRRSGQTPVTILHGPRRTVFGSSGWTGDSTEPRLEHDYFTVKAAFYLWAVLRFERRWFNGLGIVETVPFTPRPPDVPEPRWPEDGAQEQPLDVTLQWHPGPWAHRYDVYVGTDPANLALVADDVTLGPALAEDDVVTWTVTGLGADTTFYWQIVSRTMAGLERAGPVRSFRTQSAFAVAAAGTPPRRYAVPRSAWTSGQGPAEPTTAPVRETAAAEAGAGGYDAAPAATLPEREPTDKASATERTAQPRSPIQDACAAVVYGCQPSDASGEGGPSLEPDPGRASGEGGEPTGEAQARRSYPGREPDAPWRKEALERIERIRKSKVHIEALSAEGEPIEGVEIRLQMTRHKFGFGSAVTAFDLTSETVDGDQLRAIVERSFNRVVLETDLKWGPWELSNSASPGAFYSRENTDRALQWLADRRIDVRGHYVVWGHLTGDWGTSEYAVLDDVAFRDEVLRHAEEVVTATSGLIAEWDVVNHPIGWAEGTLLDRFGPHFYDLVFRKVEEWAPHARRYINEGAVLRPGGPNRDTYLQLIREMVERGVPLQGIGFMGHFFADDLPSPSDVLQTFDRYAEFGLPLQVTEFDVRYGQMGESVALSPSQEALQADFTRDVLIAAFSHPALDGVVLWGFWEGRHWYPSAALYRKDWSLKPSGEAWRDLVFEKWWTTAQGATNMHGEFTERGFLGSYRMEAHYDGRIVTCEFDLDANGISIELQLPKGDDHGPQASASGEGLDCR